MKELENYPDISKYYYSELDRLDSLRDIVLATEKAFNIQLEINSDENLKILEDSVNKYYKQIKEKEQELKDIKDGQPEYFI